MFRKIKTRKADFKSYKMTQKMMVSMDEHIADKLDFLKIFRVLGKKKLFYLISDPSPSGMCLMQEINKKEVRCVVHNSNLTSLDDFTFYTYEGHKNYTFKEVFENLNNAIKYKENFFSLQVGEQMEIAAPCFDPDHFKPYHMRFLIACCKEIIKTLDNGETNQKKNIK
tara:strand:- start:624 stop:1127 length:504 start_codon:yes stop_codon:yes gene_type:complete